MTIVIPVWILWALGIILTLFILFFAFVGLSFFLSIKDFGWRK